MHPSYHICDIPSKMTIQARKWKFENVSEFSLVIRLNLRKKIVHSAEFKGFWRSALDTYEKTFLGRVWFEYFQLQPFSVWQFEDFHNFFFVLLQSFCEVLGYFLRGEPVRPKVFSSADPRLSFPRLTLLVALPQYSKNDCYK